MKSRMLSNFHYFPLVWHLCSQANTNRMERIQKQSHQMVLDDYESDYNTLLRKANASTLRTGRIRTLATQSVENHGKDVTDPG